MVTGDTDFQGPVVMSIDHGVTRDKTNEQPIWYRRYSKKKSGMDDVTCLDGKL